MQIHKVLHAASGNMKLDVTADIRPGTFTTLYGKSGAGKSTTLKMIAGLIRPDSGFIKNNGKTWFDDHSKINVKPQRRQIGYVFQDYALFPHMTVEGNLHFALGKGEDKSMVQELIDLMELGALSNRKPGSLSGGQQQRVALARALVQRPKLLLLDEPLSALDLDMRQRLQQYIIKVHRTFGITTIMISHDRDEVIQMSDRIIELEKGRIVFDGSSADFFQHLSRDVIMKGEISEMIKNDGDFDIKIKLKDGTSQSIKIPAIEGQTLKVGDYIQLTPTFRADKLSRD